MTQATRERTILHLWRLVFLIAAIWNLIGGLPGVIAPARMFAQEFGRDLTDPVMVAVCRGAWGTALLYGFGFLMAARDPIRHSGVVLMGGTGKALFALNLAILYLQGWTTDFARVVILGAVGFVALFALYVLWLRRKGYRLI
ncbi:MAG: hypothetical protein JXR75_05120 [Rhodobacteraceae bacterium]|nr:hypothetical protein [Paracoccaceae bacterium]